jgi:hypothetical protein
MEIQSISVSDLITTMQTAHVSEILVTMICRTSEDRRQCNFYQFCYYPLLCVCVPSLFCSPGILFVFFRDNSVGVAIGYGLDDQGAGVRVPVGSRISLLHVVQTGSGAHPASCPMGTGGSFSRGKAAGAWSWPLQLVPMLRKCGSIHPLPHTPSCHSA